MYKVWQFYYTRLICVGAPLGRYYTYIIWYNNIPSGAMEFDKPSRCNWCGQNKELILGKKLDVFEGGRECRWCHRPLPERLYDNNSQKVCAACQRKYRNHQERKKP